VSTMNIHYTCEKYILVLLEECDKTRASSLQYGVTCVGSCIHSDVVCPFMKLNFILLQPSININMNCEFSITLHFQ
jgi:hypothetical protein